MPTPEQLRSSTAFPLGGGGRCAELCECVPEPAWVVDRATFRVLALNEAAIAHYGFSREEFLNKPFTDLFEPGERAAFQKKLTEAGTGKSTAESWRHLLKHGAPIGVEIAWKHLEQDGQALALVLCHDITERLASEKSAAVLASLGQRLSSARTPRQAAESIISAADELFGWDACLFDLCSPDESVLTAVMGLDTVNGQRIEVPLFSRTLGPIARETVRHGPQLVLRQSTGGFPEGSRPFGDTSRPSASIMAVPVRFGSRTLAVLSIQSYTPNAYRQADLRLLEALAEHCVGSLERLHAETEITRLNMELRSHLEELQTLFDVAPVGIAVAHDCACRQISLNAACAKVFGLDPSAGLGPDGLGGDRLPFRVSRRGQELPAAEFPMRCAAREGAIFSGQELDIVLPDGSVACCYTCASPLFSDSGQIRGSLGVFVDLTERKRAEKEILRLNSELERRVRDRTRQLEAINLELEAFSYSVSHDLRAPLRSVRGFSEVLLERYQSQLDERGRDFLHRACDSCVQMDRLIEDLLKLSRVGRGELSRRSVNLSQLAELVVGELRNTDPAREVRVVITPGLRATGDERLLRLALDNLLRNAWKFTGKQPRAVIEFGEVSQPDHAFFVRDNGAGFDMSYASRLFGVFQRLHTASEFPGTGIGLATVQRIVNRHGGRTWAVGAVNEGATFYFTLPSDAES